MGASSLQPQAAAGLDRHRPRPLDEPSGRLRSSPADWLAISRSVRPSSLMSSKSCAATSPPGKIVLTCPTCNAARSLTSVICGRFMSMTFTHCRMLSFDRGSIGPSASAVFSRSTARYECIATSRNDRVARPVTHSSNTQFIRTGSASTISAAEDRETADRPDGWHAICFPDSPSAAADRTRLPTFASPPRVRLP